MNDELQNDIYSIYESYIDNTSEKIVSLTEWVDATRRMRGNKPSTMKCVDCVVDYIQSNSGATVCPECGMVIHYTMEIAYAKKSQAYKRMTHFRDWLIKTQAKHNPIIHQDVIDICSQSDDTTFGGIKQVLKQNNFTKHYEDIFYIMSIIKPDQPIFAISPSEEASLCNLFVRVQQAWETIKPLKRKSIISYPFIITELLDIIKRPDLKKFFFLPRYNKVLEYKTQWKRITCSPVFSLSYEQERRAASPLTFSSASSTDADTS